MFTLTRLIVPPPLEFGAATLDSAFFSGARQRLTGATAV
jgi:hypothetical protein